MDFEINQLRMISARAEAVKRRYVKLEVLKNVQGPEVWLYAPKVANAGAHIYVHYPLDKNSQGFGGAVIRFELENDQVYEAKGPWHSNSDALYAATGIDLRDRHFTQVVLSKGRQYNGNKQVMTGVVYYEDHPILGAFNRYKDLIKQYPEANFYYFQSEGGSGCGPISEKDRS